MTAVADVFLLWLFRCCADSDGACRRRTIKAKHMQSRCFINFFARFRITRIFSKAFSCDCVKAYLHFSHPLRRAKWDEEKTRKVKINAWWNCVGVGRKRNSRANVVGKNRKEAFKVSFEDSLIDSREHWWGRKSFFSVLLRRQLRTCHRTHFNVGEIRREKRLGVTQLSQRWNVRRK